jgi:hypothetical protein
MENNYIFSKDKKEMFLLHDIRILIIKMVTSLNIIILILINKFKHKVM